MTSRLVIGIDLGTTNSLAAVRAGPGARVLRDGGGAALIPSVVCFTPEGVTKVGQQARDFFSTVERAALRSGRRQADPLASVVSQLAVLHSAANVLQAYLPSDGALADRLGGD